MAADRMDIIWVTPPSTLARNMGIYGGKVLVAVHAVAQFVATKMEAYSRQNAPWTDRTGNARSGLFGVVDEDIARGIVTIYLAHGHTIHYGMALELGYGGKYAIIMPTIEQHLPELKRLLDGIFR